MFAPSLCLGLLEAAPESLLLEIAKQQLTQGVSGKPNYVWDEVTDKSLLGRFGWKANQTSRFVLTPIYCCTIWAWNWRTADRISTPTDVSGVPRLCGESGGGAKLRITAIFYTTGGRAMLRKPGCGTAARRNRRERRFGVGQSPSARR